MNWLRRVARMLPRPLRSGASLLRHGQGRLDRLEAVLGPLHRRIDQLEAPDLVTPGGTAVTQLWQRTTRRLDEDQKSLAATRASIEAIRSELLRLDVLDAQRLLLTAALELSLAPKANSSAAPQLAGAGRLRVSIVINTYNRETELARTLLALRYLRNEDLEVIVVNGPSVDGTAALLADHWSDRVIVVDCPDRNLARSRNLGIAAASGEVIVFLDDDAVPEPDWIDRLLSGYDDPRVAAVGGYARDRSGIGYQVQRIVLDRFGNGDVNAPQDLAAEPFAPAMPSLLGANSSFRRDVLVALGGFDERYAFWLEEGDLLARIVDAGLAVKQVPDAEVHHAVAPSDSRNALGQTTSWLNIARSRAYFSLRNAIPGMGLGDVFAALAMQVADVRRHVDTEFREKRIDVETHTRLLGELERGTRLGIDHALTDGSRATVELPPPASLRRPFLPLLPASRRRRIALVSGLYPPRPLGGVAVFIRTLAGELATLGHEVTVITIAAPGEPASVTFEAGIWVHRIVPADRPAGNLELPGLPAERRNVALAVLSELDRVNSHRQVDWVVGALWDTDIAAAIASGRYRVGVYLVTSTAAMISGDPSPDQALMLRAEKWTLENADLVLASTQAIRRDIELAYDLRIVDDRLAVVPFGISGPALPREQSVDGRTRLVFVGRFEHRKGIDLLLGILPRLLAAHPQLEATLVGDNTIATSDGLTLWQRFAESHANQPWMNRISAPGLLSDLEVERLVAQCDIFVAPSRYESFGLVYLEAMRYGKAVIGANTGGVPEVVREGTDGLLPAPGDAEALLDAIAKLVSDQRYRDELGANGAARFAADFTVERFAQTFLAALAQFAALETSKKGGFL